MLLVFSIALFVSNVGAVQTSILTVADAYVASAQPDVNAGTSIFLYSYNWDNGTNNIYLKFDLSEIPSEANVNSIILRIHESGIYTSTPATIGVFLCDDNSWSESSITWNNAPSPSSTTPLQTVQIDTSQYGFGYYGSDYDFALTSSLKGKSEVTLVLRTLENSWSPATFDSKEGGSSPKLIVDYDMPSSLSLGLIVVTAVGVTALTVVVALTFRYQRKKKDRKQQTSPMSMLDRLSASPFE